MGWLLLTAIAGAVSASQAAGQFATYHVGNSLTHDARASWLEYWVPGHASGWHIHSGTNLNHIRDNPGSANIPHAEPYGAAKAGLNALTESFAWAFGPKVRVNAIAAGPFLTDISEAWDMEAFEARAASTIPLARGGAPEEIVGAALYLASAASSYTTGAVLRVDGGSR